MWEDNTPGIIWVTQTQDHLFKIPYSETWKDDIGNMENKAHIIQIQVI